MEKDRRYLKSTIFLIFLFFVFAQVSAQDKKHNNYADLSINERELLFQDSCNRGSMPNCYQLGLILEKTGRKAKAKELFNNSCKAGVKIACIKVNPELEEKSSDLLAWAAVILIGLAVFIIMNMMFTDEDQYKAQEKLDDADNKALGPGDHGIVLKYSRPFFRRYVTPIVSSMKSKKKIKEKYRRKLASAGLNDILTTEDFYAFKLFLIVGFPIVFMGLRWFLEETWSLKLIPVVALIGYVYPDIWIKKKIETRQTEIIRALPFAVDMLALSVEAGLDFIAAMQKVVEKAKPSALNEEFVTLIKEIKIGASRSEALRNMAWRTDLIQISSFCATLIAADSVGASIGPILKALSNEVRQKKSAEVEKAGATAATKVLFPLIFFIVPAVFIMVAAPLVIEALRG